MTLANVLALHDGVWNVRKLDSAFGLKMLDW